MQVKVNGLDQVVRYDKHGIEELLAPTLRSWIRATEDGARHVAFLAAPPGAGKSTIALLVAAHLGGIVQPLGIDGFHHPRHILGQRCITRDGVGVALSAIKGAPETFDVDALDTALASVRRGVDVRWPDYDRRVHDVVPDGPLVTSQHILLEGNYLLLDTQPWAALRRHADLTIFIQAPAQLLRRRLIDRKIQGGMTREQAEAFYQSSDARNVDLVLQHSAASTADLPLDMDGAGLLHESARS